MFLASSYAAVGMTVWNVYNNREETLQHSFPLQIEGWGGVDSSLGILFMRRGISLSAEKSSLGYYSCWCYRKL